MSKGFKNVFKAFFDFFEITFVLATVAILVYLFVGQLLEVSGDSMEPAFKDKEQLIAEKISINYKNIQRGEIIIFQHPQESGRLLIKRVVGLPGEIIMILNGQVFINNNPLEETYLPQDTFTKEGVLIKEGVEYQIEQNSYLLFGDNREKSTDSRSWGAVPKELLIGRGVIVYYPFSSIRII